MLKVIDNISERSGTVFIGWLVFVLTAVVVYSVVMRYFFQNPPVWSFEVTFFLSGVYLMLGLAYTHLHEGHVRIDVLVSRGTPRTRAIIDLVAYLVYFFPMVIVLLIYGISHVQYSWSITEEVVTVWRAPVYPAKTAIPVALFLLLLQGIASFIRTIKTAIRR